jgi:hypothetical protein
MTRGYRRTVAHLGYQWMDAKRAEQEARQRFYDALEPLEGAVLPDSREYATEGELEQQIVTGSRVAEDVLESGGTIDEAAKAVSHELEKNHPNELHNWIAGQTARRVNHE